MIFKMGTTLFLLLAILGSSMGAADWSYRSQSLWDNTCQVGTFQSPIDIQNSDVAFRDMGKIRLSNYLMRPQHQTLANDGHTVKVSFDYSLALISNGGLPTFYKFLQYHFHWGSEHLIDGVRFPLELHLVHWNTRYGTVQEAINQSDGLAVLAVLYELSEHDNPAIEKIVKHLPEILESDTTIEVNDLPTLNQLLPVDQSQFYRFYGSLTTPTCSESVIWTVFEEKQKISARQVEAFSNVKDYTGEPIIFNFRDAQDVNKRTIIRSGYLNNNLNQKLSLVNKQWEYVMQRLFCKFDSGMCLENQS